MIQDRFALRLGATHRLNGARIAKREKTGSAVGTRLDRLAREFTLLGDIAL
jgi:hypothetical protein